GALVSARASGTPGTSPRTSPPPPEPAACASRQHSATDWSRRTRSDVRGGPTLPQPLRPFPRRRSACGQRRHQAMPTQAGPGCTKNRKEQASPGRGLLSSLQLSHLSQNLFDLDVLRVQMLLDGKSCVEHCVGILIGSL